MSRIDISTLRSANVLSSPTDISRFMVDHAARLRSLAQTGDMDARNVLRSLHQQDDGTYTIRRATTIDSRLAQSKAVDPAMLKTMAEARGIAWEDGYQDRVRPYWASDERVDRYGDIVRQFWKLDEYAKNPLLLYGHDWNSPPIGNSLQEVVTTRSEPDYSGAALWMLVLFASQWDWAETVFKLVKAGFLRTGSVGLFPGAIIDIQDSEERNRLGLGKYGLIYGSAEVPNSLVEYTIASVPANPGSHFTTLKALAQRNEIGPETAFLVKELARLRHISDSFAPDAAWVSVDRSLTALFRALFPKAKIAAHEDPNTTVLADSEAETQATPAAELQECGPTAGEILARLEAVAVKVEDLSTRVDSLTTSIASMSRTTSAPADEEEASISEDLEAALESSRRTVAALTTTTPSGDSR